MANIKITDLTAYTDPLNTDVLPIVDVTSDTTKKVSIADLLKNASAGTAAAPSISFDGDPNTGIYSPGADQLAISTGGTGRLFVDESGLELGSGNIKLANVGRIFSVDGTRGSIQISAPNDGTSRRVTYGNNYYLDSDSTYKQGSAAIGGCALELTAPNAGYGTLKFIQKQDPDSGGATRDALVIYENGNVGIGTASPQSELTVRGSSPQITLEPTADTQNCRIQFALTDGTVQSQITGGGSQGSEIRFSQGPTERLRITSTGALNFVGAGTAGSTQAVSFNGSAPVNSLVIDSSGRLLVGTPSASVDARVVLQAHSGSSTQDGKLYIQRGATSLGNNTRTGQINFADSASNVGAAIESWTDDAWASGDYPGRLVFSVTADGSASTTEAMRINNARELLVGYTTDNGAYKLQVNSQIFATSATIATSDGRYKENVASLNGCLDLVKALRPVSFTWKPQENITRLDDEGNEVLVREGHNFPEGTQVGFIAQEVQEVLDGKPWLGSVIKENVRPAVKDNDGNELAPEEQFYGIAEGNLIAVLTNALQEAVGRIEALEAEVAALKS